MLERVFLSGRVCFSVTAYCSILLPVVRLWARGDFRLCCYLLSLHTWVTAETPFGRQGFSDVGGLSCTEVSMFIMLSRWCFVRLSHACVCEGCFPAVAYGCTSQSNVSALSETTK